VTREEAIKRIERERDFSRNMEKAWGEIDWKDRPDHLADPRRLSENHREYADALDMALAALREQDVTDINVGNKWISVEDRLPERKGQYMVRETWSYGNMISLAYYTPKYDGFEEHLKGRAIWYKYDSEWGDFEVRGVTHWMPLPTPPEVEA
jgi:hypothetical protein